QDPAGRRGAGEPDRALRPAGHRDRTGRRHRRADRRRTGRGARPRRHGCGPHGGPGIPRNRRRAGAAARTPHDTRGRHSLITPGATLTVSLISFPPNHLISQRARYAQTLDLIGATAIRCYGYAEVGEMLTLPD